MIPATVSEWIAAEGTARPPGVSWIPELHGFNFAVHSRYARSVTLLLYRESDLTTPLLRIPFDYLRNKSGRAWHCLVPVAAMREARFYAYLVEGPATGLPHQLHSFDPEKVLFDPYAKSIFFPPAFDRVAAIHPGSNAGRAPLAALPFEVPPMPAKPRRVRQHGFDTVIYELHVRGFTQNPNSGVTPEKRGKYLGIIEKIPYLKELGVTVVELMPVFQFDPESNNFWGYSPLSFFAPHSSYANNSVDAHNEFRAMVDEFHAAGIEVVLDVVYNHTGEGNEGGPTYSLKGIDAATAYLSSGDELRPYADYTGTGNTINFSNPYMRRLVLDSLRHWTCEMRVDGFRFDLASVFSRNSDGSLNWDDPPVLGQISSDPELGGLRLIAEPWDASGAFQLGHSFPGITWSQWNAAFRDDVRRFVRGDAGMVGALMRRLYGSDDLFPGDRMNAYHAYQSVNFVTAHDGFTLYDLVATTRSEIGQTAKTTATVTTITLVGIAVGKVTPMCPKRF